MRTSWSREPAKPRAQAARSGRSTEVGKKSQKSPGLAPIPDLFRPDVLYVPDDLSEQGLIYELKPITMMGKSTSAHDQLRIYIHLLKANGTSVQEGSFADAVTETAGGVIINGTVIDIDARLYQVMIKSPPSGSDLGMVYYALLGCDSEDDQDELMRNTLAWAVAL